MTDLRIALLRIIGDEPAPHEDPYERCRQIAADALGYQAPEPMQATDQTQRALQQAMNDVQQRALAQSARQTAINQATARSWNPYSGMTESPSERDVIELVPHGELAALKERDEARAEIVALKDELASFRSRVAERDASIVNAIRTGKVFRHV